MQLFGEEGEEVLQETIHVTRKDEGVKYQSGGDYLIVVEGTLSKMCICDEHGIWQSLLQNKYLKNKTITQVEYRPVILTFGRDLWR
jgi:hypothetical protein